MCKLSDSGKTYFVEKGIGENVIIFIHGIGLDHSMYEDQISFFSKKYRVIAYDMLGHGKSYKPRGDYKLTHYSNQLLSLIENEKVKKVNIVGFSMGALVAQLFAIKHPDKVKTLTLLNSVANRNDRQRREILERVNAVKSHGHHSTIDAAITRWFTDDFLKNNPSLIKNIIFLLKRNQTKDFLKSYIVFATSDQKLWSKINMIESPTLIITGEDDIGSTTQMSMELKNEIKNSMINIFPNVKHMLPIEASNKLNKYLFDFLLKHNF